jgi:hypothetical protein
LSDTAYPSFIGEVEALNTTTIRRLIPSARHQLPAIARVQITDGTAESREGLSCSVPKLILISRVQALLHQGQLKIKRSLPEAKVLVRELQDFRVEYTATGNLTFNARSGRHDDLVLALAIACWRAHGGGTSYQWLVDFVARQHSGSPFKPPRYFVGVDLGQSRDPTAIAIVKKIEGPTMADLAQEEATPAPADPD